MDMNKVKKGKSTPNKTSLISIRLTREDSKWIKKNDLSPTKIFDEAIKQMRNGK